MTSTASPSAPVPPEAHSADPAHPTAEKIEGYLLSTRIAYEQANPTTWILRDADWQGAQIVVQNTEPLVVFRVKLLDLPQDLPDAKAAQLFRYLLELNSSEMLQGAYALEGNALVAVEVMQSENLDQNEFLAAIDSLSLAISEHRIGVLARLA